MRLVQFKHKYKKYLPLNQYYLQSSTVFADGNTVTYHSISGFKVNIDQSVCYRLGTLDF